MTVQELIEQLKRFSPHYRVGVVHECVGFHSWIMASPTLVGRWPDNTELSPAERDRGEELPDPLCTVSLIEW